MATLGELRAIDRGVLSYRDPHKFEEFWNRYRPIRHRVIKAFCESRGITLREASTKRIPNHTPLGEAADNALADLKRFIIDDPLGPPISVFFMANTTPPAP